MDIKLFLFLLLLHHDGVISNRKWLAFLFLLLFVRLRCCRRPRRHSPKRASGKCPSCDEETFECRIRDVLATDRNFEYCENCDEEVWIDNLCGGLGPHGPQLV